MAMPGVGVANQQVASKAQMVGFTPQPQLQTKTKEAEIRNPVDDLREADADNQVGRRQDGRGVDPNQQQTQQRGSDRTQQRRISLDTPQQQKQTAQTKDTSAQATTADAAAEQPQQAPEPGKKVALDNSRSIQFQFNNTRQAGNDPTTDSSQQPMIQKQRFLNTLRSMVSTEYQQYVKSDDQLYSRRNLREIMTALSSNEDPNVARMRRAQEQADNNADNNVPGELEGYNKFNAMRAQRSLQVVATYQQDAQQYNEPLSLVA